MDDTKQQPVTQQQTSYGNTPVQPQPVQQNNGVSQPPAQPTYPISGPHKEYAPVEAPVRDYIEPHASEVAPTPQPEVQEFVEVVENKEQPQLTDDHRQVGIEHAPEATPVTISDQPSVQLPYTYQQATQVVKETSVNDSKHWLAALTEYLLRKLPLKGGANGTNT